MDRKDLTIKYNLVRSEEWQEIRKRALDKIVKYSKTQSNPMLIQGMLWAIDDIDVWKDEFEKEHEKFVKENKE